MSYTLTAEEIDGHDEILTHECPRCRAIFAQAKRVPALEADLLSAGDDLAFLDKVREENVLLRRVAEAALAYRRDERWTAKRQALDAALAAVGMKVEE